MPSGPGTLRATVDLPPVARSAAAARHLVARVLEAWAVESFCDDATLAQLQREDRVVFRYANAQGEVTAEANPNGSLDNIAGICNEGRNVIGMMPHPERSSEAMMGGTDGFNIFESVLKAVAVSS